MARTDYVASWQEPIVQILTPAYCFWGILLGRTWQVGKFYFIKGMLVILSILNLLQFFGNFSIFTFSLNIAIICLTLGAWKTRIGLFYKMTGIVGSVFGLGATLFSRYLRMAEESGFSDNTQVGSTFTRVMVVVIGLFFAVVFMKMRFKQRHALMWIPLVMFSSCCAVFCYATISSRQQKGVYANYQTLGERFRYKLVGDRGALWAYNLPRVFERPLIFKRLSSFLEERRVVRPDGGVEISIGMEVPAHNEILAALVRYGWGLGFFCIVFLFWAHFRALGGVSRYGNPQLAIMLLAPYIGVFYAVGLTGQSLLSPIFCGNGFVTVVYPGLLYGASIAKFKIQKYQNAYSLD